MWTVSQGSRLVLVAIGMLAFASACGGSTEKDAVHVIRADADVGPVMEQYLDRGISRAENNDAKVVIIELDTPGGLSTSMRSIVQRIERTRVPVVVYVSPAGGRAASAGTFIVMAANVAVMAPNTSIGAASAVNGDGSDIGGTLGRKVENDAVSFIRGIAELRGRNADWAERAVREAVSATQTQALELHVVDFVAEDRTELLLKLDGTDTLTGAGEPTQFEGLTTAPVVRTDMTPWERLLDFIADPTVASLLITLGFLGLILELANPGLVFPGVFGVIAITLGFIGFGTLPVHTAGLILVGLALLFFAIEIAFPSGFLAAGGVVALLLGAIVTFRGTEAGVRPSWVLSTVLFVGVAALFAGFLSMVVQTRRQPPIPFGTAALLGQVAVARTALAPAGVVFIHGERWMAELEGGAVAEGEPVRIIGVDGLSLKVRRENEP